LHDAAILSIRAVCSSWILVPGAKRWGFAPLSGQIGDPSLQSAHEHSCRTCRKLLRFAGTALEIA
jgi:hypothetical protein